MDFYAFLDAIEVMANKIYKYGNLADNIGAFLSNANEHFDKIAE
jgi:hypothetical protein